MSGCFRGFAGKPIYHAAIGFRNNCRLGWLFPFVFGKMPPSNKALSKRACYALEAIVLEIMCIVSGLAGTLGIKAFGRWIYSEMQGLNGVG